MVMTNERTELLAAYLMENETRAISLMEMEATEAVKLINADGYDFTAEELVEFGKKLVEFPVGKDGELDAEALENVSGGVSATQAFRAGYIAAKAYLKWVRSSMIK